MPGDARYEAVMPLQNAVLEAKERYYSEVKRQYPVGATCTYLVNGRTPKVGVILGHGYRDDIRIQQDNGKPRWISFYHIHKAISQ